MKDLDQGKLSREVGSAAVKEMWARCDQMNAGRTPEMGMFVPWRSIVIRKDISPRNVDAPTVEAYRDNHRAWSALAPVTLQAGTFVLADGRHRYHATDTVSDLILAIEQLIPDEELRDFAIKANVGHGKPYTLQERQWNARDIMDRHTDWSAPLIAEYSGVSVRWVHDRRNKAEKKAAEAGETVPPVQNALVGRDGVTRAVTNNLPPKKVKPDLKPKGKTKREPSEHDGLEEWERTHDSDESPDDPGTDTEHLGSSEVEQGAVNALVEGSSPSPGAKPQTPKQSAAQAYADRGNPSSAIEQMIMEAWNGAAAFAELARMDVAPRIFLAGKPGAASWDPLESAAGYIKRAIDESVFA